MSKVRYILVALICASPVILLWDGLITQGLIAGIFAAALMITARALRPGETEFFVSVIRPLAATVTVPALWMIMQVLPLRVDAHPIWKSAEAALGQPLAGAISVDLGASVIALGQYLSITAAAFLSAAVAVDRQRAEWLLFALAAASTLIALILLTHDLFPAGDGLSAFATTQAVDCAAMGMMIDGAAGLRAIERYETSGLNPRPSASVPLRIFTVSGAALAICTLALLLDGTHQVLVAAGCGFATLMSVTIIRRLELTTWGITVIAVFVIIAAILLVAIQPVERGKSLLLAFATSSPTTSTAVSERILDDVPLVGTGAGTFAALASIYREIDDPPAGPVATTAAATIGIELGEPMFWLIVAATVGSIFILLRASFGRWRDSFYSAMGGSCLVTLVLLAFTNAGLLGTATSLIAAATLGLAFAQSKSRAVQR